jgi:parallel beta-helix repeat protein
MNQITGNGTSADPAALRIGINLASASVDIVGGNTISNNAGTGVNLVRSSAIFSDPNFPGIPTVNTVSGNGSPASQGGVSAFLGSSATIRDAIITGNVGFGVSLSLNSAAQIASTTIQNNIAGGGGGHRVQLQLGSSLLGSPPTGSVSGNAGFGLICFDLESSATGSIGVGPNGLGTVSCTGF